MLVQSSPLCLARLAYRYGHTLMRLAPDVYVSDVTTTLKRRAFDLAKRGLGNKARTAEYVACVRVSWPRLCGLFTRVLRASPGRYSPAWPYDSRPVDASAHHRVGDVIGDGQVRAPAQTPCCT